VVGGLFYVCVVFRAFLVKMPMFMVHLCLPRSHVEAPVSGSIILPGVLLKSGGYGLLRAFPVLFKFGFRFGVV
jgi:NADH-ubiquinone oxidoreductase chain 4